MQVYWCNSFRGAKPCYGCKKPGSELCLFDYHLHKLRHIDRYNIENYIDDKLSQITLYYLIPIIKYDFPQYMSSIYKYNYDMNCKKLNIDLCPACKWNPKHEYCWVAYYSYTFRCAIKDNKVKSFILKQLAKDNKYHKYLYNAIKTYHNNYIPLYEKMAILI